MYLSLYIDNISSWMEVPRLPSQPQKEHPMKITSHMACTDLPSILEVHKRSADCTPIPCIFRSWTMDQKQQVPLIYMFQTITAILLLLPQECTNTDCKQLQWSRNQGGQGGHWPPPPIFQKGGPGPLNNQA